MSKTTTKKDISEAEALRQAKAYLAKIGAKGGKKGGLVSGESKLRGIDHPEGPHGYYKEISRKAVAARRAKSKGSRKAKSSK